MSKRHRNDRDGQQVREPRNIGPLREGYVYYRDPVGWVLVEIAIPAEVVEQYTVRKHEPDVINMLGAKMAMGIERVGNGLAR